MAPAQSFLDGVFSWGSSGRQTGDDESNPLLITVTSGAADVATTGAPSGSSGAPGPTAPGEAPCAGSEAADSQELKHRTASAAASLGKETQAEDEETYTLEHLVSHFRRHGESMGNWARLYGPAWALLVLAAAGVLLLLSTSVYPSAPLPTADMNFTSSILMTADQTKVDLGAGDGFKGGQPGAVQRLVVPKDTTLSADAKKDAADVVEMKKDAATGDGPGAKGQGREKAKHKKHERGGKNEGAGVSTASAPPVGPETFKDDPDAARNRGPVTEKCDLWSGRWVYDESYPLWQPGTCHVGMNSTGCIGMGRQDSDFMRFRWQPDGCNIPRYNADDMRRRLRGKRLIVMGDSLARNHFQSMICMLAHGLPNAEETVVEISNADNRTRLDWRVYQFKELNFTVEYYLSHFLVVQTRKPSFAAENVTSVLNADFVDWSAQHWMMDLSAELGLTMDSNTILIVNAGHWFNRGKTYDQGCYFLTNNGTVIDYNLSLVDGFEMSMRTVAKWMRKLNQELGVTTVWRAYSPVHFFGASWNHGGQCNAKWPYPEHASPADFLQHRTVKGQENVVDETLAMAEAALRVMQEADLPIIDIMPLTMMRPDGHPGPYFSYANKGQDCSHWCLPGVPDTWNELLFAYLMVRGKL